MVKAYKTLTNKTAYENFLKYGNPDGSLAVEAMGFALPKWMMKEEYKNYVLGMIFVGICVIVLSVLGVMNVDTKHCQNGILIVSRDNMTDMVLAIFKENAGNIRMRGFKNDDIVETYEQAMEVMDLNEKWGEKTNFKEVYTRMTSKKKPKKGEAPYEPVPDEDGTTPE